jgi:hypothetical protein
MTRQRRSKFGRTRSRARNMQKPQEASNKPPQRHSWIWTLLSRALWLLLLVTSCILHLEDATKNVEELIKLILRFLK